MKKRLAKKIKSRPDRYSNGRYMKALARLGWTVWSFQPVGVRIFSGGLPDGWSAAPVVYEEPQDSNA